MRASTETKLTKLYQVINTVNNKRYIGVTCKTISHRFNAHVHSALRTMSQSPFHRAIRKYGRDAFVLSELAVFSSYEDALQAERQAIATMTPEYNATAGGDGALGYRHTRSALERMSAIKKGRPSHMKGKRHTLDARQKMSVSLKGKPSYWKGRTLPPHVVDNIRRVNSNRPDWPRIRALGWQATCRSVVCLDDGLLHRSISAAARHYGIGNSAINEVCRGRVGRKTAGGRVFRYFGQHDGGADEAAAVKNAAHERQRKNLNHGQGAYMRPVICLDDGHHFASVKAAASHYGVPAWTVSKICKGTPEGKRGPKRAGGRQFRFAETP